MKHIQLMKGISPVYYYRFSYSGAHTHEALFNDGLPNSSEDFYLKPTRYDDLMYLFKESQMGFEIVTEDDKKMRNLFVGFIMDFVTGKPLQQAEYGVQISGVYKFINNHTLNGIFPALSVGNIDAKGLVDLHDGAGEYDNL